MNLPPEVTLSFDISFHPAQPGTKQFLEREQHVHKLYQNRHEQEEDFDLETTKSNASITNPGLVLSFDVNIGGKDFRFNVDNSHSHRILHVHEKELPASSQKVKDGLDASKLPTAGAGSVSQHTDTCTLSGLSIPNFDFHVVSNSERHDVEKLTDSVGFMGNFPDPSHEGLSGFAEYMLMHTISLTYERASGKDAKTKFSKGIVGLGELPPSVSSTVIYTAPSVKKQRKQYCDDLPFKLDLLYGLQEADSEALAQGGIAIWDHLRTFIMFPSDLFKKYTAAVGAELDEKTGLFTVTDERYRQMKSLFFHIGEAKHELIPNAQIWPRDLNSILGGDEHKIYLSIVDSGVNSGRGFDIVLGYAFLQRFHLVVDAPNDRLGFGPSADTKVIFN